MIVILAIFNFLFFRILSSAMFDDPLTIWASALTAIVVTTILAFAGPVGVAFSYEKTESGEQLKSINLIGVVVAASIVSCLTAYLIALGFSERLFKDLSYWSRYREFWEQDLFWFCIMISIPVVVQLTIFFYKLKTIE